MSSNPDSKRLGIYLFAGPAFGWIGYGIAALVSYGPRTLGFMLVGLVVFYPVTLILGSAPAMATFYVDQAMHDRCWPQPWRCIVSCALGGWLSFLTFRIFPFPLSELRVTGPL